MFRLAHGADQQGKDSRNGEYRNGVGELQRPARLRRVFRRICPPNPHASAQVRMASTFVHYFVDSPFGPCYVAGTEAVRGLGQV